MSQLRRVESPPENRPHAAKCWFEGEDLESHRRFRPHVTVPHAGDGLLRAISSVIDFGVAQGLSSVVMASSVPTILRGIGHRAELIEQWGYYAAPELLADPGLFFVPPVQGIVPARREVRRTTFVPDDGEVWDLFFASPFEPHNPQVRRAYLRHHGNRICHARHWTHADGPRPTIILVHGYVVSNADVNTELFNARWLFERGLDVLLFSLPFHGERAVFAPGVGFPNFDLARMAEAFGHTVHDLRVLIGWLEGRGVSRIGMMGASLGGYTTALMAGVEPRIDFAIPMIPATSLIDVMLDWRPGAVLLRPLLSYLGLDVDDVRRASAVHTPMQHDPRVSPDNLLVIAADGDGITQPYQARLLWEHWGRPRIHWFAGSHGMHVHRGTYLRELGRFLGGIGLFES
ncbi:MAG: alpha/beta hydrolase family protein [Acidimicrobiia bacterium]|nr:alpha/beta hydrolase family protein [Acidimicrobiia bacterium]